MDLVPKPGPEQRELAMLQAELGRLERDMAEREARLAAMKADQGAFEHRYWRTFAATYATLDDLEATIAERAADLDPTDQTKRRKAERLRAGNLQAPEPEARAEQTDELKALYRALSKRVHPDLAPGEPEREALMAKVNAAYQRGDVALLTQLLLGQEPGSTMERVEAQIAAVKQRLAQADAAIATADATPLARLMRHEARARAEGRDLFAKLARELADEERALRKRLKALERRLDRRGGKP
jgi:hypothetical protein